jgi:acyl transferase domain-containing protein
VLGSVKSCYGHTEGAAGVTGIFLAAESLRQRSHPGVLSLRSTNPYVAAALGDWRKAGVAASVPRQSCAGAAWQPASVAGASSFGMSGTNAHALVSVPLARVLPDSRHAAWQRLR